MALMNMYRVVNFDVSYLNFSLCPGLVFVKYIAFQMFSELVYLCIYVKKIPCSEHEVVKIQIYLEQVRHV